MARCRWRGIVGAMADSSAASMHGDPRGMGRTRRDQKGETMTRSLTLLTALSRGPRMLLALPAAALAVTLAACGSSAGPSAHPAAPKPAGIAHSHAHSAPTHAA